MFKRAPGTISGLTLTVAGLSCVLTLLVGVATFATVHHEIERQLDHRIELETAALLAAYRKGDFPALIHAVQERDARSTHSKMGYLANVDDGGSGMGYVVVDAQGRRRAGNFDAKLPRPGWSEFARFRRPDGSMGVAQAMNTALPDGGRLVVTADRRVLTRIDQALMRLFLLNFGLVVVIGLLATLGFGGIVRKRLGAIHNAAEGIMAGDFSRRMPMDGSDGEFDQLGKVLNRMLDRIGALMDNLRQVSGDIAHDLRTPLTRLRARLEEVETKATTTELRSGLDGALREVEGLQDLLAALLALSELEGRSVRDRFAPLRLDAAITELAEAYGPALEAAGMTLRLDLEPVTMTGEERLLQRALSNLLDNSLIHAGSNAVVEIALRQRGDQVELDFSDDGNGVPEAEEARIFQRFVRLDAARSTPGHGLGLSIVTAIVAAHDGTIVLAPATRGLAFRIRLPVTRALAQA